MWCLYACESSKRKLQPKTLQANLPTLEDEGVATELEDEASDEDSEWGSAEGVVGVVRVAICDVSTQACLDNESEDRPPLDLSLKEWMF